MSDGDPGCRQQKLDGYDRALAQLKRAEDLLKAALEAPGQAGLVMAQHRLVKARQDVVRATVILTGRPLDEVIWTVTDEL